MSAGDIQSEDPVKPGPLFLTTHWSVVLAARDAAAPRAAEALEQLCRAYWYPLYAFVRRQGRSPEDAQDLTQQFFAQLLEKDHLRRLTHREGRFRSFLLALLQNFLSNERQKERAVKRGGGRIPISLDDFSAEARYCVEPVDTLTPEKAFDRQWARTVIERALARLRAEYETSGKLPLFERLKDVQPGQREGPTLAELGVELAMSEGALKVAAHRLRRRQRELLREEIAQSVSTTAELEDEVRHLLSVLVE